MSERISDIPDTERPFEKFKTSGLDALSDKELLALILRSGTKDCNCLELAGKVLDKANGITGFPGSSVEDFKRISGIGEVKASQIVCIGELARRIAKTRHPQSEPLNTASVIADKYMEDLRHLKEEHILLLLLDSKFRLNKEVTLGIGSVNRTILSPREVMVNAMRYEAVNLILLHNHPSGDPNPSEDDIAITERIRRSGEIVNIPLCDHVIIGDKAYYSFADAGLLQ